MSLPPQELDSVAAVATPDCDTLENTLSLEEVRTAIGKLRNGRAAGLDDISLGLLKCAKEPISIALHTLFTKVWITGKVPADWTDAIIVSLYKGKRSKSNCARYRPTSLLSVPGRVFAHVILGRLQPLLHRQQWVWIHSWSLNGGCYSCSAASVSGTGNLQSLCMWPTWTGCLIRWTRKHYGRLTLSMCRHS